MQSKVLEYVTSSGPVLPVEVGGALNINSFLAKAYLEELTKAGKINATKETVGGTPIYFAPGQDTQANARMSEIQEKSQKTASMYAKGGVPKSPEVMEKRQEFAERYKELLRKEESSKLKTEDQSKTNLQTGLIKGLSILQRSVAQATKKMEPLVKSSKSVVKDVVPNALSYLQSQGIQEVERFENPKKKTCLDLVARAPTALGPINYWVKIITKKKLNEGDLSLAYNEGIDRKMPVLVLTSAELTKTAQNYLTTTGSFLKVKKF